MFPSDDETTSAEDSGCDETESECSRRSLQVRLIHKKSSCNLAFYHCSLEGCDTRFAVNGFASAVVRDHVRTQHLTYISYRCHAVSSPRSELGKEGVGGHERNPLLEGTVMTDAALDRHRTSARQMTHDLSHQRELLFNYVEVVLVEKGTRVYACCRCPFTHQDLAALKRHAVTHHVQLNYFKSPANDDDEGYSSFPVVGQPATQW